MSALHLLDDFLESIETLPSEIQQQFQLLHEKDFQLEELQRNLFKKRSVLLKTNDKNFDEAMQISLKKRAEKDSQKVTSLLDEKIQIQTNLLQIVEQHQQRLVKEVYKPLELVVEVNYTGEEGPFGDIPEPHFPASATATTKKSSLIMKQAQSSNILTSSSSGSFGSSSDLLLTTTSGVPSDSDIADRLSANASPRPPLLTVSSEHHQQQSSQMKVSPRKRVSLEDEPPVDPNEPVYCYCKQVSWGEMVACDSGSCPREWFHLACVNLTAPPQGKWYCNECSSSSSTSTSSKNKNK